MDYRNNIPKNDVRDSQTSQNPTMDNQTQIQGGRNRGDSSSRTNLLTEEVICAITKELEELGATRTKSAIKTRFQSMRSKMGYRLQPNKGANRPWAEKEKDIIRKYCLSMDWTAAHHELAAEGFERKKSSVVNGGKRLLDGTWRPITVEESNDIREMHQLHPALWTRISNITGIRHGTCRHHIDRLTNSGDVTALPPAPWTQNEDSLLFANIAIHSTNWRRVKYDLIGRSVASCQRRFEKLTRYLWDDESSKDLVARTRSILLQNNGNVNWYQIAHFYPPRSAVMCEVRYRYLADPNFT